MKINEPSRVSGISSYQKNSQNRTNVNGKQRSTLDEVQISNEAKELLGQSGALGKTDLQRLESLKASVASGTYHVDAGKIAEKLLPFIR